MWITVCMVVIQSYPVQKIQHFLFQIRFILIQMMHQQRLCNDVKNGHPWIQGRIRILKNHLYLFPDGTHSPVIVLCNIFSIQIHMARCQIFQFADPSSQRGFSAAGLAYNSEYLAFFHLKGNSVYRFDEFLFSKSASGNRIINFQILYSK